MIRPISHFPFGTYICVVDIDKGTGEIKVRRFVAVDDCGNIINPMIVEGQIHGGLTEGLAIAFMQEISYDENGNVQGGSFMDYLIPTSVETPHWETGKTCTPSPHHPFGAKGVGESPNVGSPAAFVNAVVDAAFPPRRKAHRHADRPLEGVEHPEGERRGELAHGDTHRKDLPGERTGRPGVESAERSEASGRLRARSEDHRTGG